MIRSKFQDTANGALSTIANHVVWGEIISVEGGVVQVAGLNGYAKVGDALRIEGDASIKAEIIAMRREVVLALPEASMTGLSPGDRAYLCANSMCRPSEEWLGNALNADGDYISGAPAPQGAVAMPLLGDDGSPEPRRSLGDRLSTGLAPTDTFLPICKGQRIGLFAGSGVGKTTLLSDLAKGMHADIVIVALIGERSREVREFVDDILMSENRDRSIIFAATCNEPAAAKRRCALMAITTAEYFRNQGRHVLLLFDSLTRFAEAHREIALTAGETPSLRAYPPSTFQALAGLAERTGCGAGESGDITAIFSVLVAGSDMDEPVADMVRSILDGHVVLERAIAERGRFPAIDIRRSVSRSLQKAVTAEENVLLMHARRLIAAYDDSSAMIKTGLYATGSDAEIDEAIKTWPHLEAFISEKTTSCEESYKKLEAALSGE